MSIARWTLSWLIALAVVLLRVTCRSRMHNDPRRELRSAGVSYIYSVLHAHQIAAVINREPNTAAMVSQSADGQLLMPAFWALGVTPSRGSSSTNRHVAHNKGGQRALQELADHLRGGNGPAYLAVDGPRGPRNRINKGIAVLAKRTGAAVLNVVAVPQRRWVFTRAWDRFQIPKPFTMVHGYCGEPLFYRPGESVEVFRQRIQTQLNELEMRCDPEEATLAAEATAARHRRVSRTAA